jgi:hypothetical protein
MGLYDNFILKESIKCSLCGEEKENGLDKFQTKELGGHLLTFKQGERVEHWPFILMDGEYSIYSSCRKCRAWIDAEVIIRDSFFIGIKNIKAKTQKEKIKEINNGTSHG